MGGFRSKHVQIFKKPKSDFKIIDTRRTTADKFRSEVPQIPGTTVKNLVAWAT